jgi:hypothetical protein
VTLAEREAYAELAEVAAQWKALADWESDQLAVLPRPKRLTLAERVSREPDLRQRLGLLPRIARTRTPTIPMPAARTDWSRTIPGMPCPKATVQTDEEPFPLCKVRHLPPPPSTPRPQDDPQHDPRSAFSRALTWTLKKPSS